MSLVSKIVCNSLNIILIKLADYKMTEYDPSVLQAAADFNVHLVF